MINSDLKLNLNIDKAIQLLNWQPIWDFKTTVEKTVEWYKNSFEYPEEIRKMTEEQIKNYSISFHRKFNTI